MVSRQRIIVAGILALTVAYVAVGGITVGLPTDDTDDDGTTVPRSKMIQPVDNGSYLWPYTASGKTTDKRTLATNLIIYGDDTRVREVLTKQTKLTWAFSETVNTTANTTTANGTTTPTAPTTTPSGETVPESEAADADTTATPTNTTTTTVRRLKPGDSIIAWDDAHGSSRYSYIDARPAGGGASWVGEAYQIHAGDYFGSRHHIRAYTKPKTNWTAVQVHSEYWDWFRLRHTVTDARGSRNTLESDFIDQPYVREVRRGYYGVDRGWNDGWISEIDLVPSPGTIVPGVGLLFAFGLLTRRTVQSLHEEARRFVGWTHANVRGFVLATAVAVLYLSVRTLGVMLEGIAQTIDPRIYLAVLYPIIAVGIPVAAFVLAQPFGATSRFERLQQLSKLVGPRIDPQAALVFGFLGLGGAFVLDFGGLGVKTIPIELAIHRVSLAFALGLIAAGAAKIDERGAGLLVVGILGWLVGLVMPLAGYV